MKDDQSNFAWHLERWTSTFWPKVPLMSNSINRKPLHIETDISSGNFAGIMIVLLVFKTFFITRISEAPSIATLFNFMSQNFCFPCNCDFISHSGTFKRKGLSERHKKWLITVFVILGAVVLSLFDLKSSNWGWRNYFSWQPDLCVCV